MFKLDKNFIAGVVVGFGAGVSFNAFKGKNLPAFRELSKSALKLSFKAFEELKLKLSRFSEDVSDVVAEAKMEAAQIPSSEIGKNKGEKKEETGAEDSSQIKLKSKPLEVDVSLGKKGKPGRKFATTTMMDLS